MSSSPKRQPAFQFYPTAWLGSVSVEVMPPEVEGTYVRLLCRQWIAETLPLNPASLRLLTKLSPAQWKKAWPMLEPHFPVTEDGAGRRNPTLSAVRQDKDEFRVQAVESGRRGAEKRWGRDSAGDSNPTPEPKRTQRQKHREPIGYPTDTLPEPQWGSDSSVSVSVSVPPSPSPSGEGSSPAAPPLAMVADAQGQCDTVLPGESLAEYRTRMRALAQPDDSHVAGIEHAEGRAAVARFLREQRVLPDRVASWVRRIVGWTNGLATSGMRLVSWEAVVLGIEELLDTNPPGQTIRPQELLTFVESAQRRLTSAPTPAKRTGPDAEREREEAHRKVLIEYAQNGDQDAIAECEKLGLDYRSVA